jgi:hypothetical protein
LHSGNAYLAGHQLKYGCGAITHRKSEGGHIFFHGNDSVIPVEEKNVNRHPHKECVNGVAGRDKQSVPLAEKPAAQQASGSFVQSFGAPDMRQKNFS